MTPTDDNIDRIEDFLMGRMDESEATAFRLEMEQNAALREEVEDYEVLYKGFRQKRMEEFGKKIAAFRKQLEVEEAMDSQTKGNPSSPKVIPLWQHKNLRRMAAAASILLLVIAGVSVAAYLGYNTQTIISRNSNILAELPKGLEEKDAVALNNGIILYTEDRFQDAIRELSKIGSSSKLFQQARFYLACCYVKTGDYGSTIEIADSIVLDSLSETHQQNLQWIRVLARFGSRKDFEQDLQKVVSDPAHANNKDALQFEKMLNSKWRRWVWWE